MEYSINTVNLIFTILCFRSFRLVFYNTGLKDMDYISIFKRKKMQRSDDFYKNR